MKFFRCWWGLNKFLGFVFYRYYIGELEEKWVCVFKVILFYFFRMFILFGFKCIMVYKCYVLVWF